MSSTLSICAAHKPGDSRSFSRTSNASLRSHRSRSFVQPRAGPPVAPPRTVGPGIPASRAIRPIDSYDHIEEFRDRSIAYCRAQHPELVDLAKDGVLVVVERQADYVERRAGYCEPEIVILVGTSHVSLTSVEHVERVIRAVRPDNTIVELCRSRASVMYIDDAPAPLPSIATRQQPGDHPSAAGAVAAAGIGTEASAGASAPVNDFSIGGAGYFESLSRSLRLGGGAAILLRVALAAISARLGAKAGAAPGGEFRAARRASLAVGAQLVLGDRPLEITLARAWGAASGGDRVQFAAFLLRGLFGSLPAMSQSEIDRVRGDDGAVRALFLALSQRHPALAAPLLHERDAYIAWSLKRSKAVNGARTVVGVLGKGHLRGVCYALTHEQDALRFEALVGRDDKGRTRKQGGADQLKRVAVEVLLGLVAWELFCAATGEVTLLGGLFGFGGVR